MWLCPDFNPDVLPLLLTGDRVIDFSGKGWHGRVYGLENGSEIIGFKDTLVFVKIPSGSFGVY